jgi:hypothetical protein
MCTHTLLSCALETGLEEASSGVLEVIDLQLCSGKSQAHFVFTLYKRERGTCMLNTKVAIEGGKIAYL